MAKTLKDLPDDMNLDNVPFMLTKELQTAVAQYTTNPVNVPMYVAGTTMGEFWISPDPPTVKERRLYLFPFMTLSLLNCTIVEPKKTYYESYKLKKIRKEFYGWLKARGIKEQYMNNVFANYSRADGMIRLHETMLDTPEHLITALFAGHETPEGTAFWRDANEDWNYYYVFGL